MNSSKTCCFELFGFDVLIDKQMKPWLLEVNSSPSLNASSPLDRTIKGKVVSQLLDLTGVIAYDRKKYETKLEDDKYDKRIALITFFVEKPEFSAQVRVPAGSKIVPALQNSNPTI